MSTPEQSPTGTASISPVDSELVAWAEALIGIGGISGGRLLLKRSALCGHPRADFLLAETFGLNALSRLRVLGMRGDAQKARGGYTRVLALEVAGNRLEMLK